MVIKMQNSISPEVKPNGSERYKPSDWWKRPERIRTTMKGLKNFGSVIGKTVPGPSSVRQFIWWRESQDTRLQGHLEEEYLVWWEEFRDFFFLLPDKGNLPNSTHSLKHTDTTVNHSAQTAADHGGLGKRRGQNEESKIKEKAGG